MMQGPTLFLLTFLVLAFADNDELKISFTVNLQEFVRVHEVQAQMIADHDAVIAEKERTVQALNDTAQTLSARLDQTMQALSQTKGECKNSFPLSRRKTSFTVVGEDV